MLLPATRARGIVVFKLWPSLAYPARMAVAFGLVLIGFALQAAMFNVLPGAVLIGIGNLLLLVSGFNNRVDFGRYRPDSQWERVDHERLDDLIALDNKMQKWDLDSLDVSNWLGGLLFLIIAAAAGFAIALLEAFPRILAIDAALLLLPHWLTGIRRILRQPLIVIKVDVIRTLLRVGQAALARDRVDVLMLFQGKDTRIPTDVKFKASPEGAAPEFLGLYGQVVLNDVQGKSFPYFYVVLVAKKGFGLRPAFDRYVAPAGLIKEFKLQGDVEVWVIRQFTTKKSGYHTKPEKMVRILDAGLQQADGVATGA